MEMSVYTAEIILKSTAQAITSVQIKTLYLFLNVGGGENSGWGVFVIVMQNTLSVELRQQHVLSEMFGNDSVR